MRDGPEAARTPGEPVPALLKNTPAAVSRDIPRAAGRRFLSTGDDRKRDRLPAPMNTVAAIEARHAAGQRLRERLFRGATLAAALLVLLLLGGVALSLAVGAWPALSHFKLAFLTREIWNPVTDQYGALAPVYGTLVTSFLALLLAIPVSFGIAIFLTELAPVWLKRPVGVAIELLAAVPSIIYGIWGLFVLAPILQAHVQPWLIRWFGPLPLVGRLFQGPPFGIGILSASFVLAIMVIPFISAVMRDVFETVPDVLKESGYGLGATTWEVIWQVVVPYARTGMIGGVMLGLGRALGETMAVTFVIGNAHRIGSSLLAPGTTISASIANEFAEAVGDLYTSSLIALGAILFLITFTVIALARYMLMRLERRALSSL
jgi:phosphate transport system permease protein